MKEICKLGFQPNIINTMKEKEFINIIKDVIGTEYIGDDCAYLRDLGIVISQDSLVEDVHFKREFCTPFQLGYKSVMVNISDICASGAKPEYLTSSLSLPNDIDVDFVKKFYEGAKYACEICSTPNGEVRRGSIQIVGGDITSADKIYISVCAIGNTKGRNISSRKNAQEGYKVVVCGLHGSSAAGLKLLLNGANEPQKFIKAHLEPKAQIEFSQQISTFYHSEGVRPKNLSPCAEFMPYAMMDTSDGLMDALSAIANESGVLLEVDFDKIPYDKDIEQFDKWQDMVLFGGEDYGLVAVVPQDFELGVQIGVAKKGLGVDLVYSDSVILSEEKAILRAEALRMTKAKNLTQNKDKHTIHYSKQDVENKIFNHFNI